MSDCERIAQVFYLKKERFAHFLFFGERCERIAQVAHQKWAMWVNPSGRSPKMSDHKRFAQVAQQNERPWANCSGRSPKKSEWTNRKFFWANRSFAHFWAKNERFAQKTNERIPSPASRVSFTFINFNLSVQCFILFEDQTFLNHTNSPNLSFPCIMFEAMIFFFFQER